MPMKWNATSVSATCIIIGLGGFMLGKITSDSSVRTEEELLIERSNSVSSNRISQSSSGEGREQTTRRPNRPTPSRGESSFDDKLVKMEEIVRGENALDRGRAMLEWIDSLSPEEFESAVDRFRSLGLTEARMGEYAMLLTAWAQVDPVGALAYTTEKTGGGMATNTVLSAWANRDPEAAIAWAKSNHQGDEANPYMAGIIRGIAEMNPGRATDLLQELPFSGERAEALSAMIPHVLKQGSEAAKKWIAELKDDRLRDGAISRFAEELAKQDPAGTASWLLANLGDASSRSVDDVFREWARKDSSAAMGYFQDLPQGEARSNALRGLVIADARNNPEAAAELMNRYPNDITDRTAQHFVWHTFDKAPDVAVKQIGLIQDERSRNRMYERALGAWMERDSAAAQQWINSANLPQSVVDAVIPGIPR